MKIIKSVELINKINNSLFSIILLKNIILFAYYIILSYLIICFDSIKVSEVKVEKKFSYKEKKRGVFTKQKL